MFACNAKVPPVLMRLCLVAAAFVSGGCSRYEVTAGLDRFNNRLESATDAMEKMSRGIQAWDARQDKERAEQKTAQTTGNEVRKRPESLEPPLRRKVPRNTRPDMSGDQEKEKEA